MSEVAEPSVGEAAPTRARTTVLWFLLLLAAIGYLDRVCISTASLAIQRDLGITKTQMGTVFSVFILCYALFEVPGAWLARGGGPARHGRGQRARGLGERHHLPPRSRSSRPSPGR